MWTLLLLAATVRSFAHMPLGISDRSSTYFSPNWFYLNKDWWCIAKWKSSFPVYKLTDLLATILVAYNYGKIDILVSFTCCRRMRAESRQIPQKLATRLKFLCFLQSVSLLTIFFWLWIAKSIITQVVNR